MQTHNYRYTTREDAQKVLNALQDVINGCNVATVADLKALSGISSRCIDDQYGWKTIDGMKIVEIGGLFLLDFPLPEKTNRISVIERPPVTTREANTQDPRVQLLARIENDFTLHPPVASYIGEAMDALRAKAKEFAYEIVDKGCVPSREVSTALTLLEQALFYAIASVARYQPSPESLAEEVTKEH